MPFQNSKLKSLKKCKELISKARIESKVVVFTNGCFDILHAGHVDYLERAKRHGDFNLLF